MVPWINYYKKLKAGYDMFQSGRRFGLRGLLKTINRNLGSNVKGILKDTGRLSKNIATAIETASKGADWLATGNHFSKFAPYLVDALRYIDQGASSAGDWVGKFSGNK